VSLVPDIAFTLSAASAGGFSVAAQDIQYVELYVNDKHSVIEYFTQSLGFALVAESADYRSSSVLLRQGQVQVLITAGPGTCEFLDAHGDGVADIALACDNVGESYDAAVAAGARPAGLALGGQPAVSGFGGVSHTLFPASASAHTRLPAGRSWQGAPRPAIRTEPRVRLLDHIAVCVQGGALEDYADFYRDAFGLERYSSEYVDIGSQAMDSIVVRNPSGSVTLTLVAPDPAKGAGQLDAFLERNGGPGVQHLAFAVQDIILAVCEFRDRGVEFLRTPASYYQILAERFPDMRAEIADLKAAHVLADRDEWGYLLQLFTRSPHERSTLFYELIQRRGARGFGSANIRALYEAVERDRLATE
jgi:4-hydroxymandelate synthase